MSASSVPTRDEYLSRLRLAVEQSLVSEGSSREVAAVTGISHAIVCRIRKKARAVDMDWSAVQDLPTAALYDILASPLKRRGRRKQLPDFEYIRRRLEEPGMTREKLHYEYSQLYGARALCYSRFCDVLDKFRLPETATMKQTFVPGHRIEIDFSGDKPWYIDKKGSRIKVGLMCFVLPATGYSYACCVGSEDIDDVIAAMLRAFTFFGGAPRTIVPDNFKAAVLTAGTEKLRIQPDFLRFAQAHGCAVLPARARSPTNKGTVERLVRQLQSYLLPELAKRTHRSFEALDAAVADMIAVYNDLPLSETLLGSRREEFEKREQATLLSLPEIPYLHRHHIGRFKVARRHYVRVLDNFYSVPFELVGKRVEAFVVNNRVEILHEGDVVASHARSREQLAYVLDPAHEKQAHQAQRKRDRDGIERWAREVGPHTWQFVSNLFSSETISEQALPAAQALHSACQEVAADYVERVAGACLEGNLTTVTDFKRMLRMLRTSNLIDPNNPRLLPRLPPPSAPRPTSVAPAHQA